MTITKYNYGTYVTVSAPEIDISPDGAGYDLVLSDDNSSIIIDRLTLDDIRHLAKKLNKLIKES